MSNVTLKEDEDAQANRQASPSAMDIYDTVKVKAPSCATIQQELMGAETGDSSMQGQTSWISCGIKIQEMQLAIRYQLQSEGAQLTIEDCNVSTECWSNLDPEAFLVSTIAKHMACNLDNNL
ncbi:hypothetical protein EI94DRAFT_1805344 [Lactarius quietus]|nr:hypothetical protein EI94DRAFT_1805344 [Lactarius quietus]